MSFSVFSRSASRPSRKSSKSRQMRSLSLDRSLATRSGIALSNGEIWDGIERRSSKLIVGSVGDPDARPAEEILSSTDFFG